jgi:hypothetical protein
MNYQGRYEECVSKLKPYLKQVGDTIKKDVNTAICTMHLY